MQTTFKFVIITLLLNFLIGSLLWRGLALAGFKQKRTEFFLNYWSGFVVTIIFIQFYSVFSRIDKNAFTVLGVLATLGLILELIHVVYSIRNKSFYLKGIIPSRRLVASLIAFGIVLFFICYAAGKTVSWPDTIFYHYNGVKWISEFPALPGLALVHDRFAYNPTFWIFAALYNIGQNKEGAAHIAEACLIAPVILNLICFVLSKRQTSASIFSLLMLPTLIGRAYSNEMNSLSTDFAMTGIVVIGCVFIMKRIRSQEVVLITALAATAMTFKLSAVPLAICWFIFLGWRFFFQEKRSGIITAMILAFLVLLGFVIRNVIISGWLVYPFPIGNLHLPWSLPEDAVLGMMRTIQSWARVPGPLYYTAADAPTIQWLLPWLERYRPFPEMLAVLASMIILLMIFGIGKSLNVRARARQLCLLGVGIIGLCFLMISAPDLRFGGLYIWILFSASFVLLIRDKSVRAMPSSVFMLVLFCGLLWMNNGLYPVFNESVSMHQVKKESTEPVKQTKTEEGLVVYLPENDTVCGNSEIPCLPYGIKFKLRNGKDVSGGFLPLKH